MQTYWINNCYLTQIEDTGLNFRFGYTCFGIAPSQSFWHRGVNELPKWYRILFPFSFKFFYHSAQCDRRYIFKIHLGALQMWYLTNGEGKDEYCGFHVAWHGLKEWRMIV